MTIAPVPTRPGPAPGRPRRPGPARASRRPGQPVPFPLPDPYLVTLAKGSIAELPTRQPLRLGLVGFRLEPRIPGRVLRAVVGVEVDEAALDLPVADFEDVAPAAGRPLR